MAKQVLEQEERWRLAKELYMAWEYTDALEHLIVLKEEWAHRINVYRYLAAAFYRLGRYDEAAATMQDAIERWPDEVGLYEQLARVLEVSGKRVAAVRVWQQVRKIAPQHPMAAAAIQRIEEPPLDEAHDELHLSDSDSGVDLRPGVICPHCGAQNSEEFERCWQCHGALYPDVPSGAAKDAAPPVRRILSGNVVRALLLGGTIALLALDGYLALHMLSTAETAGASVTFEDLYNKELAWSRLFFGLSCVFGWPVILMALTPYLEGKDFVPRGHVILTGFFLGAAAWLLTWLPPLYLGLLVIVPPLLAAFTVLTYALPASRSALLWAAQLFCITLLSYGVVAASEMIQAGRWLNPVSETAAVLDYMSSPELREQRELVHQTRRELPFELHVIWKPTSSAWLNLRAGAVEAELDTADPSPDLVFEIQDVSGTREYRPIRIGRWSKSYDVAPGESYTYIVSGESQKPVSLRLQSLLAPHILETPTPTPSAPDAAPAPPVPRAD